MKAIRECKERYLVYFAYTTLKFTKGGYKEDPKPYITTEYDIFSSDSLDSIREHRELLLSLMSKDNSYAFVIVDRFETKILKKIIRAVRFETIFEKNNITSKRIQGTVKFEYSRKDKGKVFPLLGYDWNNKLAEIDFFFRGPSEVPEDYRWDGPEEYSGWLQYRWGDGLNAIPKDNGKE